MDSKLRWQHLCYGSLTWMSRIAFLRPCCSCHPGRRCSQRAEAPSTFRFPTWYFSKLVGVLKIPFHNKFFTCNFLPTCVQKHVAKGQWCPPTSPQHLPAPFLAASHRGGGCCCCWPWSLGMHLPSILPQHPYLRSPRPLSTIPAPVGSDVPFPPLKGHASIPPPPGRVEHTG